MFRKKNINLFSKTLLFITGSVYIINYLLKGFLSDIFHLNPELIVKNYEYWRFITYPLATGTMEGVLLFALSFYVISTKLEDVLKRSYYPLLLFLLISLQGIVFALFYLFSGININISGMEGISLFVLTLYILLRPSEKVAFLNFPILSTTVFSVSLFSVWAGLKYYNVTVNMEPEIESAIASIVFGIGSALIMFVQIRLLQILIRRRYKDQRSNVNLPQEEEPSYAFMTQAKLRKYYQEQDRISEEDDILLSNNPDENEQILNDILDKINIHGTDSITIPEKRFLKEYSKYLK